MRYAIMLAIPSHGIDLIFHQRDERRNYNGRALLNQSRQLEAKRFSSPCRHKNESIFPLQ